MKKGLEATEAMMSLRAFVINALLVFCISVATMGCGATKSIPDFGIKSSGLGSGSVSTSTGWSGASTIDSSVSGLSNRVANDSTVNQPALCLDASGGFSASGCVQQPALVYSGGRFFVGFPQKLTTAVTAAAYEDHNILSAISNATTFLFNGFGLGTGYLNTFSAATEVARYVTYAKLSSGRVVGLYVIASSATSSNEVYANVWDPLTNTWGVMTQLSTGTGVNADTVDIAFENYDDNAAATDPTVGRVGNYCKPKIAASGNTAMALWCERRSVDDTANSINSSYLRYSRYNGVSWQQEAARRSSALLAQAGGAGNGMNEDSAGTTADLRTTYRPGMARRVPVPTFVPNGLFTTRSVGGVMADVDVVYPIPNRTAALAGGAFAFATPSGSQLDSNCALTAHGLSAVHDMLFVADTGSNRINVYYDLPKVGDNDCDPGAGGFRLTTAGAGVSALLAPRDVFSDGLRLVVSASVRIAFWNTTPNSATNGNEITDAAITDAEQIIIANNRLFLANDAVAAASVLAWYPIPTTTGATAPTYALSGLTQVRAVASDGKRLFIGGLDAGAPGAGRIYIFNTIPTAAVADVPASADVIINLTVLPKRLATDGLRLFMSAVDDNVYVWRKIPLENKVHDFTITGFGTALGLSWTRFVPDSWPYVDPADDDLYSVNPNLPVEDGGVVKNDALTITHHGQTVTIDDFIGDPTSSNRCVAIANIVDQINANTQFKAMGLTAQLPSSWEGPACEDDVRGIGQFFYVTQNAEFSPDGGVDNSTTLLSAASVSDSANNLFEDIRILLLGDATQNEPVYRFFGQSTICDNNPCDLTDVDDQPRKLVEAYRPTVAGVDAAQYVVGRRGDAPTATSRSNSYPVLPANGMASNPDAGVAADAAFDNRPVDLSATSFVDVVGLGSGRFNVVAAHRAWAQPAYNLSCGVLSGTVGCTNFEANSVVATTANTNRLHYIPSELAYPRTVFGYHFTGSDWTRLHNSTLAIPRPWFLGPTEPYSVDYTTRAVQPIPLGARAPRAVSGGNGKGLVLFYGRNGQRPYTDIASALYRSSATYDEASELSVANALWMSTFDLSTGYSAASVVSPDTSSEQLSASSLATDLDVCDGGRPFAGVGAVATLGTAADACLVGDDPYLVTAGANTLSDTYAYTHDFAPIPAAMNSNGKGVVGMHRLDTNTTTQYIGFYVALYGAETGLGAFTRIDNSASHTMGGAVAIDDSGNIAAVWEARSLVTRTAALRATCDDTTTLSQAENHVYYRYYNASTASWGSITQVDSSSITCYGNSSFGANAPEAPMMPNVVFGDSGRVLVSYSGPACNTPASSTCRRRQFVNQYVP